MKSTKYKNSDAGELPRRHHTTFRKQLKFGIKITCTLFFAAQRQSEVVEQQSVMFQSIYTSVFFSAKNL